MCKQHRKKTFSRQFKFSTSNDGTKIEIDKKYFKFLSNISLNNHSNSTHKRESVTCYMRAICKVSINFEYLENWLLSFHETL